MMFAKDLGPIVQTIARRKLLGWFPTKKSIFSMTSTNNHWGPSARDTAFTASMCQNFVDQVHRHPMDSEGDSKGKKMNMSDKMGTTSLKVQGGSNTSNPSVCLSHKLHQNQSSGNQLCPSGDLKSLSVGFKITGNASTTLVNDAKLNIKARALELAFNPSRSNLMRLGSKNTDMSSFSHSEVSTSKLSPCSLGEDNHGRAEQGPFFVVRSSCEAAGVMTTDRCKTSTPHFIFDLPYLRARLGQANSLGQDTFLQQS